MPVQMLSHTLPLVPKHSLMELIQLRLWNRTQELSTPATACLNKYRIVCEMCSTQFLLCQRFHKLNIAVGFQHITVIDCVLPVRFQGCVPMFVNATAGSTVYGAFDPINEIADICEKYNMWLHVDVSEPSLASSIQQAS